MGEPENTSSDDVIKREDATGGQLPDTELEPASSARAEKQPDETSADEDETTQLPATEVISSGPDACDDATAAQDTPEGEDKGVATAGAEPDEPEMPEDAGSSSAAAIQKETAPKLPAIEKLDSLVTRRNMLILVAACAVFLIAFICSAVSCSSADSARQSAERTASGYQRRIDKLEEEKEALQTEVDTLEGEVDELKNGASALLVKIKNAFEAEDWEEVVSLYKELHQAYNGSAEDTEAKELADQAQAKIDEEKAAEEQRKAEEEAAKKAEEERKAQEAAAEEQRKAEEAAKAYDTGITYDQIARDPEGYAGSKLTFTGKVLQVQRGDYSTVIRLAVDSDYDHVVLCSYLNSATPTRVLEDDIITVKAVVIGETSYTSVLGATITLPEIYADEVAIQ